MALLIGRGRDLSYEEGMSVLHGLEKIPEQMREVLAQSDDVRKLAEKYKINHFRFCFRRAGYRFSLLH